METEIPNDGASQVDTTEQRISSMVEFLEEVYLEAEEVAEADLGVDAPLCIQHLKDSRHAARGLMLTCATYKALYPDQNILLTKAGTGEGGFSVRTYDEKATVEFLTRHNLYHNVQGHMQTSSLSFANYAEGDAPKTQPRQIGEWLLESMKYLQDSQSPKKEARDFVLAILVGMIREREKELGQLVASPRGLTVDAAMSLVRRHVSGDYGKNSARLPQLAMYAMYQCIVGQLPRYTGCALAPLESQTTANRKTGSVGDIDVRSEDGRLFEAVETKHKRPVTESMVIESEDKIRFSPPDRYLILTTGDKNPEEADEILKVVRRVKANYGCEVIVNGVFDTLNYYLRLLPSVDLFIGKYAELLKSDKEVNYKVKDAWNKICAES